ncbi:MAG: hypothetical protein ACR2PS_11310, partial [Pseudomonadales bacterium]
LLNYAEPKGDFWAVVPGTTSKRVYPSTIAYVAQLVIHRFAKVGILGEEGHPTVPMGILESPDVPTQRSVGDSEAGAMAVMSGRLCKECGMHAVARIDGCDRCTACGELGACG